MKNKFFTSGFVFMQNRPQTHKEREVYYENQISKVFISMYLRTRPRVSNVTVGKYNAKTRCIHIYNYIFEMR